MLLSQEVLASIFGDVNLFCGAEDVIHAIIYHHLLEAKLSPLQVAREYKASNGSKQRTDIAVFEQQVQGQFKSTKLPPTLLVEVKGGAHGKIHALTNNNKQGIEPDGFCRDMAKLEEYAAKGIESWFICVDLPELGGAIENQLIERIYNQCRVRQISFAYFCRGKEYFMYAPINSKESNVKIENNQDSGTDPHVESILNTNNPLFIEMYESLLKIEGHEANITAALYRLFRKSGLIASQISLETYFSFAKAGKKMPIRPDLVLFNHAFDGAFNLYQQGNRNQPNDSHKLAHMNTIFEVKGSVSLKSYIKDLEKLRNWQTLINNNGYKGIKGYFICVDRRKKALPQSDKQEIFDRAENTTVIYMSNAGIEISA